MVWSVISIIAVSRKHASHTQTDVRTSAHIECRRVRGAAYKCTSACFPFLVFSQANTLIHTSVHSYVHLHPHICAERHASTKTQALHTHTLILILSCTLSLSLSLSLTGTFLSLTLYTLTALPGCVTLSRPVLKSHE